MAEKRPSTFKVVIAALLDFLLVFVVGGYVIGTMTGGVTENGFQLNGLPAIVLFAVIAIYFIGMKRLGGTVFQRLFGIAQA